MILKLTRMIEAFADTDSIEYDGPTYQVDAPTWVNTDLIRQLWEGGRGIGAVIDLTGRAAEDTALLFVAETPEQIAAAIDPENACPDPPGECGYQEYLAYRKDGESDLSHGAYHGAVQLAEQHGRSCKVYETGRICPTCQRHEQRIRA